jgi:hypothetical protein
MTPELIDPECIRTDGGTQSRAGLDAKTVDEYTEAYRSAEVLPPVVLYFDGEDYWLADGFHRVAACIRSELVEIDAIIHQGTRRDAVLHAVGANASHGLRRSPADKRRAIETLLRDEEWSAWSNREIARRCAVHHELVGTVRAELTGGSASETARTYTTKHGTPAVMETAAIGRATAYQRGLEQLDAEHEAATSAEASTPESPLDADTDTDGDLPDDERAPFDAYWTPPWTADACVQWLADTFDLPDEVEAVEPAVGGGAWVQAWRKVRPLANVARFDLDPDAPGLAGARRTGGSGNGAGEMHVVGDWLTWEPNRYTRRATWDICAGNRPYNGDLARWIEVSLERAPLVAYLERETITGTEGRLPWWLAHRPAWICKVVPRPKWKGPGSRRAADMSDSVLIVWVRGHVGGTQFDWIHAPEPKREGRT